MIYVADTRADRFMFCVMSYDFPTFLWALKLKQIDFGLKSHPKNSYFCSFYKIGCNNQFILNLCIYFEDLSSLKKVISSLCLSGYVIHFMLHPLL